ncbi:MAG: alanine--tRNA ligase [Oscillospiraceae bacterium]|jgi:alanyl-tRNA synthetase|nr:alanine--tRNA ligase [Oscillospiraceae bacterium]
MQPLGLNEIREKFLSFYEGKGHLRLPSFPLIPQGDASLLLINSGMAPLKPYFSGEVTPPRARATTCQKCIRTPDIERVGQTSRHGTFFEMLGNFSFGDYFKREAAAWAWEFCTGVMAMPPDKLYISVYLDDDEAYDIWTKEIGVEPSHMTRLGKADNFWEIGAGPCGPCSEIYFDRGAENGCGSPDCKVGCDCDRYVEFWNLVFTQFSNDGQGNYTPLKQKNIDTGMGLERLACLMQGVDNLFEVDTIKRIREHISAIAGVPYRQSDRSDISLRIVTDHIRSTTMLVCDGVLPSNEGRGYVLRRLLRRAARHGRLLGVRKPFLFEVCRTVVENSEQAYPALREKADAIARVIRAEEERFEKTIDAGLGLLRETVERLRAAGTSELPGDSAFKLYDTFGFPVDLTVEILEEEHMTLDRATFDALMKQQRERARAARAALGDQGWAALDLGLDRDLRTVFTGYDALTGRGRVLAIAAEGALRDSVSEGETVSVALDETPFYAESGGQVADAGQLVSENAVLRVDDVKKTKDGKYLHIGEVLSGELSKGETVSAQVDAERRRAVARAHSATHLLHSALRQVLGDHVEQAGSLVEPDRLRFDFTHYAAVTPEQLADVTDRVNRMALTVTPVSVREMPVAEAKALGAMALFGEKYGDVVRVVRMGELSVELCGGTHLENTAGVGLFAPLGESSVAAGVRRVEAHVGLRALADTRTDAALLDSLAARFKVRPQELTARAEQTLTGLRAAQRALEKLRADGQRGGLETLLASAKTVGGLKVIAAEQPGADPETLRAAGDFLRDKEPNLAAVLAVLTEDKITFLAVCGKEAVARGVRAGDLIKAVSQAAGGSGGGRPDSAMGGGKDPSKLNEALSLVEGLVETRLNAK